jgi:hypothetical protein
MNNRKASSIVIGVLVILAAVLLFKSKPSVPPVSDPAPIVDLAPVPQVSGNVADLVAFSIAPGAAVSGVVNATGSIKGAYFFEANIRVNVLDASKNVLKEGNGTATSDWMTSDPVSFAATIDFAGIPAGVGYVRLMNDNPSGMPENDKWIDIPVVFKY